MRKDKKKVEITLEEYEELLKAEAKLRLLDIGGVDNWDWYSDSLEDLDEEYEEIEEMIEGLL